MKISFFVPGKPAPGGSKTLWITPQGRRNLQDAGKGNKAWKKLVAKVAKEEYRGEPLSGPLEVEFAFTVERGKTVKRAYPTVPPDTTKLIRAAEDACKGILWVDDSQIVRQSASKNYGAMPGVRITVWEMEG